MSRTVNNFKADLISGKNVEDRVMEAMKKKYKYLSNFITIDVHVLENPDMKLSDFDFSCVYTKKDVCKVITFEVKNDKMSERTGNFAIEFWNNYSNIASGIESTKAEYYIIVDSQYYYMVRTDALKKYIEDNENIMKIKGGYENRASMYLIPKDDIIQYMNICEI